MRVVLENEPYLNVPQAARRIGVSAETVRRRIKRGEIPARKLGFQLFILEKDIEALAGEHEKANYQRDSTICL